MLTKTRAWLLCLLIVFLPLSAWLVSYSGDYLVSLGRDILLFLFVVLSLFDRAAWRRPTALFWLALAFTALTLASYFVRQDSVTQWLRGVRYLAEPMILIGSLIIFPLEERYRRWLAIAVVTSLVVVLIGSTVDYLAPNLLRTTLHSGGRGFLGQINYAITAVRLQSTLAGPNALGLYLMIILLLTYFWRSAIARPLTIVLLVLGLIGLALTFSRSSYLGLFVGLVYLLVAGRTFIARWRVWLGALVIIGVIAVAGLATFKPAQLTRIGSNDIRLEQYQRVWNERDQIGFWGRGAGTAGLVSEFSFDNSPNYFTENTYLDIYENIGLLGVIVYLVLWIGVIIALTRRAEPAATAAAAAAVGLLVAGLFIDHFTGQAALWITLLIAISLLARPSLVPAAQTDNEAERPSERRLPERIDAR